MEDRHNVEAFLRGIADAHPGVRLGPLFGHLAVFAGRRVFSRVVNDRLLCRLQCYPDVPSDRWVGISTTGAVDRLVAVVILERAAVAAVVQLDNAERPATSWPGLP